MLKLTYKIILAIGFSLLLFGCQTGEVIRTASENATAVPPDKIAVIGSDPWSQKLIVGGLDGVIEKSFDLGELKTEQIWAAPQAQKIIAKAKYNRWYIADSAGVKSLNIQAPGLVGTGEYAGSPGATKLALVNLYDPASSTGDGSLEIIDLASGTETRLAAANIVKGFDKLLGIRNPVFSPGGDRIAYDDYLSYQADGQTLSGPYSPGQRQGAIFISDLAGNSKKLVDNGQQPVWSPQGNRLAFIRYSVHPTDNGAPLVYPDVYVINADGSGLTKVAEKADNPLLSVDGTLVAYSAAPPINQQENSPVALYISRMDGQENNLIASGGKAVAWSPTANELIFAVQSKDNEKTTNRYYVYNADQLYKQELGDGYKDIAPVWSPQGNKILLSTINPDSPDKPAVTITSNDAKWIQNVEGLTLTDVKGVAWVK